MLQRLLENYVKSKNGVYPPIIAQTKYEKHKRNYARNQCLSNPKLWKKMRNLFVDLQWFLEQISNRIKLEKNELKRYYNTIYQAIYNGLFEREKLSQGNRGLRRSLRYKEKTRHILKDITKRDLKSQSPIRFTNVLRLLSKEAKLRIGEPIWLLEKLVVLV